MNNSISVLFVSTYPPQTDGIAEYTHHLATSLSEAGIEVSIASPIKDWNTPLQFFQRVLQKSGNSSIVHFQFSYSVYGNILNALVMPALMLTLLLLKKKVVCTLHDVVPLSSLRRDFFQRYGSDDLWQIKKFLFKGFTKMLGKLSSHIIVLNPLGKITLVQDYNFNAEKVSLIEHGIEPIKKDTLSENGQVFVTFYGFLKKGKGLEELLDAWKIIYEQTGAILQIVGGEHPYRKDDSLNTLKRKISELNIQRGVLITGFVKDEDLHEYFRRSSAFVFPYNEWGDIIFSSGAVAKVLSYMKPIILTDVPAFRSLIDVGGALVCERGNVDSLVENILSALSTDAKCLRVLSNLAKATESRSWKVIAHQTVGLYSDLIFFK